MIQHRCEDIAQVLPGNEPYAVFHRSHCTDFDKNAHLKIQKINWWDQFIDIKKLEKSQVCRQNFIGQDKICLIGKSSRKMQCVIKNSIIISPYTKGDVLGMAHSCQDPEVHDEAWQRDHMQKLGDIVIKMLDHCDGDIREYLASEQIPNEMRPVDLLSSAHSNNDPRLNTSITVSQKH